MYTRGNLYEGGSMKFAAIGLVVLVTSTFMLSPAHADGTGQVNFFVGQKSLDDDDWMPVEDQPEFGAVMSFGQVDWPVHIAVDVLGSATEEDIFLGGNVTVTGMTFEIDAGVRKIWGRRSCRTSGPVSPSSARR